MDTKTISNRATRNTVSLLAAILLACCPAALLSAELDLSRLPPPAGRTVDFARDIQPLFESRCFQCHGPDTQKSGLRLDIKAAALRGGDEHAPDIRPGHSAESPLIHLVAGITPDPRMPQKGKPLTTEEIGLLRAWIDQGAPWPDDGKLAQELPWSFKPIDRPEPPVSKYPARNDIDRFIGSALEKRGLRPSPEADRRILIRRLYFDIIGLPPTPQEFRRFQEDKRPDAYERLVDQLLASPHYGERWARHWLDIIRFAETHGFEMNNPRNTAWTFRDYVIRAFNDDKPYNQFLKEQLAGDSLGVDEATGFLVAGPWDQVKSPDVVLTRNQRADELHDIVSTTSSAFLGLTVGCARCHTHKFDPILQTDYYAFKACFAGVQHGERKRRPNSADTTEREAAALRNRLSSIDAELARYEPLAWVGNGESPRIRRGSVNARSNTDRFAPVLTQRLRFIIDKTNGGEPCIDELEVFTAEKEPRNAALASAGATTTASGTLPGFAIHKLEHINDGQHGNDHSWISNERGRGWVRLEFAEPVRIDRVLWGRDREQRFKDRVATEYRIEVASDTNTWQLVAGSSDRGPFMEGGQANLTFEWLPIADRERAKQLTEKRLEIESQLKQFSGGPMIYAGQFTDPETTFRLNRGDPMQPREEIAPGALSTLSVPFDLPQAVPEPQRRLALAEWIVHPANPLTPRVIVNRIWQYHFGEGLVRTPSDFGANGDEPSHPDLLDWLAAKFIDGGWSIKAIHRLILNSATYRQSSQARPESLAADAATRFLWRYPPRRLDAEPIRDAILAVSGALDQRMGGPGFSFFQPNDNYVRVYTPKTEFGPGDWRRMVYGTVVRQRPDGVFGVFDCPDGGQIAPKRTRSTTPLQALNLLNSPFMLQQAHLLASRLEADAGPDPTAQIQLAFSLAFNRLPNPEELAAAQEFARQEGLPVFCRALLNANEFVYVF